MKLQIIKAIVSIVIGLGIGTAFIMWFPFLFSLAWPGLVLSRLGIPHSWLFAFALMVGLCVWLGLWSKKKLWWQAVVVSLVVSMSYCGIAFLYVTRFPVPLPSVTPYDVAPTQRSDYLQAYDSGYRDGMVGMIRTYCFYPEAETRGFYEGSYHGSEVFYRFLGRHMPERHRRLTQGSAGIDGVNVDLK